MIRQRQKCGVRVSSNGSLSCNDWEALSERVSLSLSLFELSLSVYTSRRRKRVKEWKSLITFASFSFHHLSLLIHLLACGRLFDDVCSAKALFSVISNQCSVRETMCWVHWVKTLRENTRLSGDIRVHCVKRKRKLQIFGRGFHRNVKGNPVQITLASFQYKKTIQ